MTDNLSVRSTREIPKKASDDIGIRHMRNDFQPQLMSCRLHEVAPKFNFLKKEANSLVLDSSRTVEARAKLTTALLF